MKTFRLLQLLTAVSTAACLSACSGIQITHVPPGKSARAEAAAPTAPAAIPVTTPVPGAEMPVAALSPGQLPPGGLPPLPAGDTKLPSGNGSDVADSYSRGAFAMQAGQNAEAIAAFEQTVKLDPDFTDAWGKLAILYQKAGDNAKATNAFKKAKRLGDPNGGTVTRDSSEGLQPQ